MKAVAETHTTSFNARTSVGKRQVFCVGDKQKIAKHPIRPALTGRWRSMEGSDDGEPAPPPPEMRRGPMRRSDSEGAAVTGAAGPDKHRRVVQAGDSI
jgi:hypothetical protein